MAATVLATMDTGYYLVHTKLLLNIFVCFFAEKMNEKKNKQTNKSTNVTKPNLNPNQTIKRNQNPPNLHEKLNNTLTLRNGHALNKWENAENYQ